MEYISELSMKTSRIIEKECDSLQRYDMTHNVIFVNLYN